MQTTIKDDIKFVGIGVHTNTKSTMILKPSEPGSGISFRRTDVKDPGKNTIKANYKNVKSTYYCTEIFFTFLLNNSTQTSPWRPFGFKIFPIEIKSRGG